MWTRSITRFVKWCLDGKRYGKLAISDKGAFWICPSHLTNRSLSKNNLSCCTNGRWCDCDFRLDVSTKKASYWTVQSNFKLALASSNVVSCLVFVGFIHLMILVKLNVYAVTVSNFCRVLYHLMSLTFRDQLGNFEDWIGCLIHILLVQLTTKRLGPQLASIFAWSREGSHDGPCF